MLQKVFFQRKMGDWKKQLLLWGRFLVKERNKLSDASASVPLGLQLLKTQLLMCYFAQLGKPWRGFYKKELVDCQKNANDVDQR